MDVHVVDPSAFTPPYDHALCAALGRAGASVELITSAFPYGEVPAAEGYARRQRFYRHVPGGAGSTVRRVAKAAVHAPEMLAYRRVAAAADVVHFQWLDMQWLDRWLLPRGPLVLTAHDLLPREPRPGQARAQRRIYDAVDAVVVHSAYGAEQLICGLRLDPAKVAVIPHGAFTHLTGAPDSAPLPPELRDAEGPVVLFFGLLRPYKGLETLLAAWRGIESAQLWIVGAPRMPLAPLRALAPTGVRFVPRFVPDAEVAACFRRADVVVLPYARTERFDQSGVLATALAFGKAIILTDIGGFGEVAATGAAQLVAPDDPEALHQALGCLLADPGARELVAQAAARAARETFSWEVAAQRTIALYQRLLGR
jgi:glycosyltransferase involved in cell wall biosynthesis